VAPFCYFFRHLHVWDVLEDEGLVELGVEVFSVDLRLEFRLLVRKQVHLHEGIGEAGRPIGRGEVGGLDDLKLIIFAFTASSLGNRSYCLFCCGRSR